MVWLRARWKILILPVSALILVGVIAVVSLGSGDSDGAGPASQPSEESDSGPAPSELSEPSFAVSAYSNIHVIDVATRSLDRLTSNKDDQIAKDPSWSSKGGIAFSQAPRGQDFARLFLVNPDGSEEREVPTRITHLFQPSWSPDGGRIAVVLLGRGIYSVNARDGTARRLTKGESDDAPAWSPDGEWIAFNKQVKATNWDLYAVNPETGEIRRLTRDPLQQTNPAWSPDGSRIAFAEQQTNGNWAIYTMKSDGSDRKRLTDQDRSSQEPSWSPDGERIAFVQQEGSRAFIELVDADGGGRPVRITPTSVVAAHPVWSPDGKKIAFGAQAVVRPAPSPQPGAGL